MAIETKSQLINFVRSNPARFLDVINTDNNMREDLTKMLKDWNVEDIRDVAVLLQKNEYKDWFNGKSIVHPQEEVASAFQKWAIIQQKELLQNPYHKIEPFLTFSNRERMNFLKQEEDDELKFKHEEKKKLELLEKIKKNDELTKVQHEFITQIMKANKDKLEKMLANLERQYQRQLHYLNNAIKNSDLSNNPVFIELTQWLMTGAKKENVVNPFAIALINMSSNDKSWGKMLKELKDKNKITKEQFEEAKNINNVSDRIKFVQENINPPDVLNSSAVREYVANKNNNNKAKEAAKSANNVTGDNSFKNSTLFNNNDIASKTNIVNNTQEEIVNNTQEEKKLVNSPIINEDLFDNIKDQPNKNNENNISMGLV